MQRRSLASHVEEVMLAPFLFVLINAVGTAWLLLVIPLCLAAIWLMGGDAGGFTWTGDETFVFGGIVLVLWFAASLLAIRDRWKVEYVPHWHSQGNAQFLNAAERFVTAVMVHDLSAAREWISESPQLENRIADFSTEALFPPVLSSKDYALAARELTPSDVDFHQEVVIGFDGQRLPVDALTRSLVEVAFRGIDAQDAEFLDRAIVRVVFDGEQFRVEDFIFE
jgi:hypothetical protein